MRALKFTSWFLWLISSEVLYGKEITKIFSKISEWACQYREAEGRQRISVLTSFPGE